MKGKIASVMVMIAVIALIAIGWYFFIYTPGPEPTDTPFGAVGTSLTLVYDDGTERAVVAPLSVYDDGKRLTLVRYELWGKAVGAGYSNVVVKFDDYFVDYKVKQGTTVKYTFTEIFGPGGPYPAIPDANLPVTGLWEDLIAFNNGITDIVPNSLPDGMYTVSLEPRGSLSYNPDNEGWIDSNLPDIVSFTVEVRGLLVYFKHADY